jgi:N-acetylglutamate synthase-like GNAT family acetyltransferase
MQEIIVRDAHINDAAGLAKLISQLGYRTSETEAMEKINTYQKNTYKLLVAEKSGLLAGYVALHYYDTLHWKKPIGRINSFCVAEEHRGTGVGIELVKAAENYFKNIDCQKIEVSTNKRRTETRKFYINRGYQELSILFSKL